MLICRLLFSILLISSSPGLAAPVTVALSGEITAVLGPEPVGGVAVGDPFGFDITYESTAIAGSGNETLFFDGISLTDASVLLTVGSESFDETSNGGGTSTLSFEDGHLVGYNYRGAQFSPASGAQYFLFLEDGLFTQHFSVLPLGVMETQVTGTMPIPEPTTALLLGLGLAGLSMRRRATTDTP
ncbi:MAG: PEP-CTERM sorting domain-containing protein [Myxococcota bacterium]|nr:PEP-CTERM sorting domain-containing protein [Myxococcota bacterium]